MKKDLCLKAVIAVLAILGIMLILNKKKEAFHNLTPGIYPESDTKGLLYPAYQMKNNPGLSDLDMQKAYKLYPSYAVGSYAQVTNNNFFIARSDLIRPSLDSLSKLDDKKFRIFFSTSPIKRIGRDRFIRNVLIAIGNSKLKSLIPNVIKLLDDQSILVQVAAVWALGKISRDIFLEEKCKRINLLDSNELSDEWHLTELELN